MPRKLNTTQKIQYKFWMNAQELISTEKLALSYFDQ
jgi:hypothetical protein